MRFHELSEARPWRHYRGRARPCLINDGNKTVQATASYGIIETGKTRTFQGHFVKIAGPDGQEWLGTDDHSVRRALVQAADYAANDGWKVEAAGLTLSFRESGLSWNTGQGYVADSDRAVHMLDPPQSN